MPFCGFEEGLRLLSWLGKPSVVAFADDYNGEARQALRGVVSWIEFLTRFPKERQFLVKNDIILAFGHAIAVDLDILRVSVFVCFSPRDGDET